MPGLGRPAHLLGADGLVVGCDRCGRFFDMPARPPPDTQRRRQYPLAPACRHDVGLGAVSASEQGRRAMVAVHTAGDPPDLWKFGNDAPTVWPEYNLHGDVINQWWGLLA